MPDTPAFGPDTQAPTKQAAAAPPVTAEQLRQMYLYAAQLRKQVEHPRVWSEGLQNAAGSIMGALAQNRANEAATQQGESASHAFDALMPGAGAAAPAATGTPTADAGSGTSDNGAVGEHEDYIRRGAIARGLDPNVMARTARSEGLGASSYAGDQGTSFGDFQLHYGHQVPGGNAAPGLGDDFTKATGLDARDPSTWKQQADYSLDYAAKNGLTPWHGWKGDPRAAGGQQVAFDGSPQPSGAALPPDAQRTVQALQSGNPGGQARNPVVDQYVAALQQAARMNPAAAPELIREALSLKQQMMPQFPMNPDTGQVYRTQPGVMPQYAGQVPGFRKIMPAGTNIPGMVEITYGPNGEPRQRYIPPDFSGGRQQSGDAAATPPTGPQPPDYPTSYKEAYAFPGRLKGYEKGQEEVASTGAEAATVPLKEAYERGGQKANDVIQVLDRMEDAYKNAAKTGGIGGGPAKETLLKLQEGVNQFVPGTFDPNKVAAAEVVKKSTAELALKQIKEASSRGGTQREFIAMLDNNPGIALSDPGALYMIDILRQQAQRDRDIGKIAGKHLAGNDPYTFQDAVDKHYAEHPIMSPFSHKPLMGDQVDQDRQELMKRTQLASGGTSDTGMPAGMIPEGPPPVAKVKKFNPATGTIE